MKSESGVIGYDDTGGPMNAKRDAGEVGRTNLPDLQGAREAAQSCVDLHGRHGHDASGAYLTARDALARLLPPAAILALIAEIERLEQHLAELKLSHDDVMNRLAFAQRMAAQGHHAIAREVLQPDGAATPADRGRM